MRASTEFLDTAGSPSSTPSGMKLIPPFAQSWRRNWPRIIPFFDYPPETRKVIYTNNAIESVNMSLRKITKNHGSFPNDKALMKLSTSRYRISLRNGRCRFAIGRLR